MQLSPSAIHDAWERAPALLMSLGRAGDVLALNARWSRLFDLSREDLIGRSLGERLSSRDMPAFYEALATVIREGEVEFDASFLCASDNVHPMRWTLSWSAERECIEGHASEIIAESGRGHLVTPPMGIETPALLGAELVTMVERTHSVVLTVVNEAGEIRYESPSLTRITGHLPEEIVGRHAMDMVHPEDQSKLNHALRLLASSSERSGGPFEYRWKQKRGGWIWASTTFVQLLEDGRHDGWVMSTRDVTEWREDYELMSARLRDLEDIRTRMRSELAEMRSRQEVAVTRRTETDVRRSLEGLGQALSVGLAVYRLREGTFERVYVNDEARRLTRGTTGLEALGPKALSQARTALLSSTPMTLPARELSAPDGKVEVTPVMFGLGEETVGLLLQPKRSVPDRLLALNHELRTPLASTLGYLELALDGAQGELADDLHQAYSAAQQVRLFIDLAVEAARLEAREGDVYLERVQLKGLVQEVRGAWTSISPERVGTVWVDDDAEVYTDRRALRLVMLSLLATQRLDREGPGAAMKLSRTPRSLLIEFAPPREEDFSEITRALERPLKRGARTMRELASAVARGLIARLGGTMRCGETITVSLPSRAMLRTPVGGIRLADVAAHASKDLEGDGPLALVIDDDPEIHAQLRACLEPAGWRVKSTIDGSSGIQMAKTLRPHVVVLDVVMPSVDGWSVLSQLRNEADLKDLPVVIQSIVVDDDLCRALGASGSMNKPVDGPKVVETLARFIAPSTVAACLGLDEEYMEALELALERKGMRCEEAADATEALQMLRTGKATTLALGPLAQGDLAGLLMDARRLTRERVAPSILLMTRARTDAVLEAELERWRHGVAREPSEVERALDRALPWEPKS